jgi:hypothetical protein
MKTFAALITTSEWPDPRYLNPSMPLKNSLEVKCEPQIFPPNLCDANRLWK